MAQKRPGKPRRRSAKPQRGRKNTPAALVFLAGAAVAVLILFFVYAFWWLPAQKATQSRGQARTEASQAAAPGQGPPAAGAPQTGPAQSGPAQPGEDQAKAQAGAQSAAPAAREDKTDGARLAIVIDDLGGSLQQAQDLLELNLPVTFSVLPNLPHTREVDALAAKAGREVILHQPMEAHGQAATVAGTLRTGMTVPEVAAILTENLAQLPHAVGVSNHTGSRATEDPVLMAAVMTALKQKGLFFLDSLTTAKSVAGNLAARSAVPYLARNVFLDNERGQQAALLMLEQAEKDARQKGYAIAIGHPYPETIAALATWSINRDRKIRLVTLGRRPGN